jgi:hypothetical protein
MRNRESEHKTNQMNWRIEDMFRIFSRWLSIFILMAFLLSACGGTTLQTEAPAATQAPAATEAMAEAPAGAEKPAATEAPLQLIARNHSNSCCNRGVGG